MIFPGSDPGPCSQGLSRLERQAMDKPLPAKLTRVILFTAAYMAMTGTVAFVAGTPGLAMYLGLMCVLIPSLYLLHRRHPLSTALVWCFSVWGLAHMAGGLLPIPGAWSREGAHAVLYSWWIVPGYLKYDEVVHAYGFGITTWLCWHLFRSVLRSPDGTSVPPSFLILMLCVAGGMGFGALNEVVEFFATRLLPDTNVGDYENIGWDLVANLAGSLVAAAVIRRFEKKRLRSPGG